MTHEHTFEDICDEDVCGPCYEKELMKGKVQFAPKHATKHVEVFLSAHAKSYRYKMDLLKARGER